MNRVCECSGVSGSAQPGTIFVQEIFDCSGARRHHRQTARGGFEQNIGQAVAVAVARGSTRHGEKIGFLHRGDNLRVSLPAEKRHAILQIALRANFFQSIFFRAFTNDFQMKVVVFHRFQQNRKTFFIDQSTDREYSNRRVQFPSRAKFVLRNLNSVRRIKNFILNFRREISQKTRAFARAAGREFCVT